MPTDAQIAETVDYVALRRLQDAYADIVTRRAWAELHDVFLPSITLHLDRRSLDPMVFTGPGEIGSFIDRMIEPLDFFEFVILGTRVVIGPEPDHAAARMYMCELRQDRETGHFHEIYGVYHDRFRRVDGTWWFAERRYHSLARGERDLTVFPFPGGDLLR
jgi:hypothetical protein